MFPTKLAELALLFVTIIFSSLSRIWIKVINTRQFNRYNFEKLKNDRQFLIVLYDSKAGLFAGKFSIIIQFEKDFSRRDPTKR